MTLTLNWGAVFAGVGASLVAHLLLRSSARAPLLPALIAGTGQGADPGVAVSAAAILSATSLLIPAAVGALVAARTARLVDAADGALHGAAVWAGTQVLFALLAVFALAPAAGDFRTMLAHVSVAPATRALEWLAPGLAGGQTHAASPVRGATVARSAAEREVGPAVITDIQRTLGVPPEHAVRLAHHFRSYMVVLALRSPEDAAPADGRESRERRTRVGAGAQGTAPSDPRTTSRFFIATLGSLLLAIAAGAVAVSRPARQDGAREPGR